MDHVHFALSPIHGVGVFASEDIEPGTRIVQEMALWIVDKVTAIRGSFPTSLDATEMRSIMIESFKRSNPFEEGSAQKKEHEENILNLCGGFTPGQEMPKDPAEFQKMLSEKLRQILILNAVHESGDGQTKWASVFRGTSRVNHSCTPNAERVLATDDNGAWWSTITTTAQIKKGEEVFLNYLDPLALFATRQEKLQSRWGFTCACKLCSGTQGEVAASDIRRAAIKTTLNLITEFRATQSYRFIVGELGWKRLEALAVEEGVNDMTLYEAMGITANAAIRTGMITLEMELASRILAVSTTHK